MKKMKIAYWLITGLISLLFLASAWMYLTKNEQIATNMAKAGYPPFLLQILGVAKLLGALALVNPWSEKLKEWAYAGIVFVLIGAIWTHVATSTSFVPPFIFLVLTLGSYYLNSRVLQLRVRS